MKAIRVRETGAPEVMQLETVPDPSPGAGQLVLKVHAVGVNPVETYVRAGTYPLRAELPYTPGMDAAGVVAAVGEGVTEFKAGDRVYTAATASGAYAEQALCEAKSVFALPDNISFAQGAAIGVPYATAHRALFFRGKAQAGETVLVHGASGGVGLAAVQLARGAGLTVIGTAGSERGLRLVERQGAHFVFDHSEEGYLHDILGTNCGRGVDIILEMLANVNLSKDLSILAKFGRVVVIGNRGTVEINPRDLMMRDADVRGMTLTSATPDEVKAIHVELGAGLRSGQLNPVIDKEIPLAQAARAHHEILEPGSHGKIVLVP